MQQQPEVGDHDGGLVDGEAERRPPQEVLAVDVVVVRPQEVEAEEGDERVPEALQEPDRELTHVQKSDREKKGVEITGLILRSRSAKLQNGMLENVVRLGVFTTYRYTGILSGHIGPGTVQYEM